MAFTFEYLHFKAMNIIAKLSFWILDPRRQKTSIIAKLLLQPVQLEPFEGPILAVLDQFKTGGYVENIKTSITPESLPSNKKDLLEFLYNQIAHV